MRIIVTGRHVSLTDEIKKHIDDKAGKLPRHYDRVHELDVIVSQDAGAMEVEMIARADHQHRFVAKERNANVLACIDLVVESLGRQLTKHKEKTRNRMHEGRGDVHGGPSAVQSENEEKNQ